MKVFVSYRRADAKHLAGRIADRLLIDEAIDDVFFDVAAIRSGDDFVESIERALDRCDVVLVLVGEAWRGLRDDGTVRLFDDDDPVRLEVRRALERDDVRVVPVLHGGAPMPRPDDVPADLRPLLRRNATSIRHDAFDRDVDHVAAEITGRRERPLTTSAWKTRLAGLGAAAALLLLVAIVHGALLGRSLDASLGTTGVWLLILATLAAGVWSGPRAFTR